MIKKGENGKKFNFNQHSKTKTMPLAQLPVSTVKLIGSTQVITSVSAVVKELMENSIDSGATNIEIKLNKHGLEKIEVKDDGCGVGKSDVMIMCLPHYTSKISNFSDLDSLSSYGFRGEALSALCNVAQVCVTTKTADDEIASCYTYDHNGQVIITKLSHITKGTIITVTDLFKNLPVRKQFVSSSKRATEGLKKVEKIVKSLAIIHPRLRVILTHNKFLIWQKTSVANLRESVMQVISLAIVKQLHHVLHNLQQIRVELLVPKRDCDVSSLCFSNFSDAFFLFVNRRPIRSKEIEKTVYGKLSEYFGVYMPVKKYPVSIVCLTVPSDCLDVNLEPDKSRVYFKNQDDILDIVKQCMHLYYGDQEKAAGEDESSNKKSNKKRKAEGDCSGLDSKKVIIVEEYISEESKVVEAFASQNITPAENKTLIENQPDRGTDTEEVCGCDLGVIQQDMDHIAEKSNLERNTKFKNATEYKSLRYDNDFSEVQIDTTIINVDNPIVSNFFSLGINQNIPTENQSKLSQNENITSFITRDNICDINTDAQPNASIERNNLLCLEIKDTSKVSLNVTKTEESDQCLSPNKCKNKAVPAQTELHSNRAVCDNDVITLEHRKSIPDSSIWNHPEASVELPSFTLSQWSRGEVTTISGASVKGSCILTDGSGAASPLTSQALSNRSVSSQMGCKEMSAFTKFARSMRKQILEEQPDMSFTKVAQLLQVHWRQLTEQDKKKYEETSTLKKVSGSTPVGNQKKLSFSTTGLLNSMPHLELEVNMSILKQAVKGSIEKERNITLIGQLEATPLWLYHTNESGVTILSIPRLLEAVKFHKFLAKFALPSMLLDISIPVTSRDLGDPEWRLLYTLERSPNGVIKDSRLVSNGFLVEIVEDKEVALLTSVPQNMSYCGVEELREVLMLVQAQGLHATLAHCRPLKVISFIRSEVMRECSQEEIPTNREQVMELLSYWLNHIAPETQSCIHYKPIVHSLDTS